MSNTSPFGSASHFGNIGSWKAGSHTSISLLLKSQSRQLLTFWSSLIAQLRAKSLYCTNLGDHNSVTKPSASLHNTIFFCSCNEGMGMMQPFNAEMAERTAALRNLKLLIGWMLGIPKNSGNGFLKKHVEHISFRQCVTFCEHRQLKGWQPHFQLTVAKNSISAIVYWFAAITCHTWEHNQKPAIQILDTITALSVTNRVCDNSVGKPSASLHEIAFFSATATKGWAWCNHNNAELV